MPLDQQKNQWCVINSMQTFRVHSCLAFVLLYGSKLSGWGLPCLALQRECHDWQGSRQMVCADMDGVLGCSL